MAPVQRAALPVGREQAPKRATDRAVPAGMVLVWGALFFNVLGFTGPTVASTPIPQPVGQVLAQGSLVLALLLALVVNPRGVVRPNVLLILLTTLGVVALMVSIHNEFALGSTYRALRLLGFLAVLWLLTPWWGRRDMLLLRCHRRILWVILGTVIAGAALAPGSAFAFEGRLSGVLWPIPPTQVAHYAAVLFGTSAVLWLCGVISDRHAFVALAITGATLVSTHTRTALVATLLGLACASASLFLRHARVRRVTALGVVGGIFAVTAFASELTAWVLRGQTTEQASQLTGRTKTWSAALNAQRSEIEALFGSGLSDLSFNGLPIDSSWVAAFVNQGWFGVIVQAVVLLFLLVAAATRERGPHQATALFLVVYCSVASVTESGVSGASPYALDLTVAAALLASQGQRRAR